MSVVAFLNDSSEVFKSRFEMKDVIKVFFSPFENNCSYRNYFCIKDIYDYSRYCNKLLKEILDIRKNKNYRDWIGIVNSLLFIEIFFYFLNGKYLTKAIKNIIERTKPDYIYVSKRLPPYFVGFIREEFPHIKVKNGKGYDIIRWLFTGTLRVIIKSVLLIINRIHLISLSRSISLNKILFLIQFWRVDSEALLPVIKRAKDKGVSFNLVTSSIGAYNRLKDEGCLPIEIESGLSISDIISGIVLSYILWFKTLHEFIRKTSQKGLSRTFKRLMLYCDAFRPNTIYQFIMTLYGIRGILSNLKPSTVVVADDLHSTGRASCIIARKMGIPSICLQNGPMSVEDYGFIPIFADKFIAWGEEVKSSFISYGEEASKIEVCGSPRYDELFQKIDVSGKYDCEYILYASSMYEDKELDEDISAIKMVCKHLRVKLLISPHPAMNEDYFVKKLEDGDIQYEIERGGLVSAIKKSRLVIIGNSGAGIEAILMGKDLIIYNPGHISGIIPFAKYGSAIEVNNKDELLEKVKSLLSGNINLEEGRKRFICAYLSGVDGRSCDRVLEVIEGLRKR